MSHSPPTQRARANSREVLGFLAETARRRHSNVVGSSSPLSSQGSQERFAGSPSPVDDQLLVSRGSDASLEGARSHSGSEGPSEFADRILQDFSPNSMHLRIETLGNALQKLADERDQGINTAKQQFSSQVRLLEAQSTEDFVFAAATLESVVGDRNKEIAEIRKQKDALGKEFQDIQQMLQNKNLEGIDEVKKGIAGITKEIESIEKQLRTKSDGVHVLERRRVELLKAVDQVHQLVSLSLSSVQRTEAKPNSQELLNLRAEATAARALHKNAVEEVERLQLECQKLQLQLDSVHESAERSRLDSMNAKAQLQSLRSSPPPKRSDEASDEELKKLYALSDFLCDELKGAQEDQRALRDSVERLQVRKGGHSEMNTKIVYESMECVCKELKAAVQEKEDLRRRVEDLEQSALSTAQQLRDSGALNSAPRVSSPETGAMTLAYDTVMEANRQLKTLARSSASPSRGQSPNFASRNEESLRSWLDFHERRVKELETKVMNLEGENARLTKRQNDATNEVKTKDAELQKLRSENQILHKDVRDTLNLRAEDVMAADTLKRRLDVLESRVPIGIDVTRGVDYIAPGVVTSLSRATTLSPTRAGRASPHRFRSISPTSTGRVSPSRHSPGRSSPRKMSPRYDLGSVDVGSGGELRYPSPTRYGEESMSRTLAQVRSNLHSS